MRATPNGALKHFKASAYEPPCITSLEQVLANLHDKVCLRVRLPSYNVRDVFLGNPFPPPFQLIASIWVNVFLKSAKHNSKHFMP